MLTKNSQLPRRAKCCALKEEPFVPGSEYVSSLTSEGERSDYCVHCWKEVEKEGFYWKGKIPRRKVEPLTHDEKALTYFRSIYGEKEKQKALFILAQYLERKRQLVKLTDAKNPNMLFYELPESGELFSVEPQRIAPEEAEDISEEIVDNLAHG